MTDSPTEPKPSDGSENDKSTRQLQVEDQLFRHRMALKQHDYQIISAEERLTLTVIQALSQAFLVIAVVAGLGVLTGLSLAEALGLLEHGILVLAGFAFLVIGISSFFFGEQGLVQTISRLREGPPEPPDELSDVLEEHTDGNERDRTP